MLNQPDSPVPAGIMICEDERLVAEDIADALRDLGYQVPDIVSSGEEAIHTAAELTPDLILIDMELQGEIDGIQTVEKIHDFLDVPVVYLTPYTGKDIPQEAKWSEPYGYLSKPVGMAELKGTVELALYKHKADKRVKESVAQYRAILRTSPDAFCLLDTQGRILEVNDAYCRMTGYSGRELAGMTVEDLEVNETSEEVDAHIKKVIADGSDRFETILRRKDGSFMQAEVSVQFLAGDPGRIFTFSRDITDRKKAEENLRDSERRYRELVETISDGIVQTNRLGTVTFANAAYCRMLGFTMEEMIGKSILEFQVTDSKREEMRAYLDDVCREKPAVIPWFGNHRTRDGVMLFVQADWNYRLDHLGNVIGFISVVKDITERKKAEEALRESEERYRKVFEQGPLGMALVGPDYRFREVNRILCDMLGYKEHELKDLTFVDVTHPDHISEDLKHARQLKTGEIPYYKTEKRYIMQDGGILWANLVASVIRAGEGNVLYTLAMIEDITDRKRVEEQIKNSLREKEVLLREVHHRVKNNLAVVHSLLRLQSKGARDDFHQRMFEDAQDRIRSMALAHERLCQSDDLANVNMNEYMIGLVDHLVQTQKGIGPTFVVEKHIESAHLGLDKAVPLGFLINELVSNSLKHAYTNRTQGTLLISFRRLDEKEYELIVKDDGTGFPEGVDLESPQSLGLSLVKLFTKQIDGEIKLLRDEGTEFRIEFSDSP